MIQSDTLLQAPVSPLPTPPLRLASIDVYRGLVMFLMMAEVLNFREVSQNLPGNMFWELLHRPQSHVPWVGCSLHDLIQPSFSFLVGVALPFSLASRLSRGQSKARMTAHALWRSLILIALGIFLRSRHDSQTYYTFEDTLSQIGLGYTFLFVLAFFSVRVQWIALAVILIGYWAAFAFYPASGADFDYATTRVSRSFSAHWDINSNAAWAFDTWFLNLFPRKQPFVGNDGGYSTLSIIPTLATMILGLLAGGVLRRPWRSGSKILWLIVAGLVGLAAGWGLGDLSDYPVVKRIWTPSWVLFSGGWCFLFLGGFYAVLDLLGFRSWAFPLQVIGMSSITAYCMFGLFEDFIKENLKIHVGKDAFKILGSPYEPLLHGAAALLVLWLILFWMYRRKIFLRISRIARPRQAIRLRPAILHLGFENEKTIMETEMMGMVLVTAKIEKLPPQFRILRGFPRMRHIAILTNCWILTFLMATPPAHCQPASAAGRSVRLEVTRDTWVSDVGQEVDGNNGAASRLKVKSIQEMTLLDVDSARLQGRTIRSAALHVRRSDNEPLRRVTVSGIGAEWFEGSGSSYSVQPGGATFRRRRHPDLFWSTGGGDLCHVILGNGGTTWRMADASSPDREDWQRVRVDPRVVAARMAGLSYGFLVFDDTGSEWARHGEAFTQRVFPNRFIFSREQNRSSAPFFQVEFGPDDHQPPAAPSGLQSESQTALLPAGEAMISWVTPRDSGPAGTLGFFVEIEGQPLPRELIPMAGAAGERVAMLLRDVELAPGATVRLSVRAVDGAGNLGPATTARIRVSDRVPAPLPQPKPAPAMPRAVPPARPLYWGGDSAPTLIAILDELDKVHPDTGELIPSQPEGYLAVNHLWDAAGRRVTFHAARNEFVAFQVLLRSPIPVPPGSIRPELVFDGPAGKAIQVEFGRYHPVRSRSGPFSDPIVPLDSPWPADAAAAKNQSLHAEVYVPHHIPAGDYPGTLTFSPRSGVGQGTLRLAVTLRVWDFTLPDHLSFLPEMNCYGLPENERDYYRLAHRHRTVLNRVPYNQSGQTADGCAPRWNARRLDLDWSDWDRRFGPLLDGSAFADLPRKGVPVECFYLPLHENWPTPMEGHYNGDYWADRAFPETYRRAFVAASRRIAEHARAKGWTETLFHGFLNNKNNFKDRGWSRGSSPWLLDEPANFQDYWALRYFARAFHEGINQAVADDPAGKRPVPRLVFRADISRPHWRRDSLDGLMDYHVVGGAMRTYPRLVFDRKRAFGEIVVEYGSTNPIEGSNLQPVGWCLDAWSLGADGVLPWQTVGNADSWDRADELALFYPAAGGLRARRGRETRAQHEGVIPSVRLKAYRRGQQDVEYLTLWSRLHNEPRWAVGRQVRASLGLAGVRRGTGITDAEDAGRIDYTRLRPQDVWALRVAIGEAISRARPAPASKLVDFRTPRRDPEHLPQADISGDPGRDP
jgi:heparan-alpha-glucosaminide N-acetyltransferase